LLQNRLYSGDSIVWACWWWLRSPGNNSNNAANVNDDGSVNINGNNVNNASGGVRPALPQPHFARNLAPSGAGLCYGAKESDSLLTHKSRKTRVGGNGNAATLFSRFAGMAIDFCHPRRRLYSKLTRYFKVHLP